MKITLREIKRAGACLEAVGSFCRCFGESATDAEAYNWLKEHPDWLVWATGHPRWCKILLAHGADVNAKNSYGTTPLHWGSSAEIVKILEAAIAKAKGA